MWAADHDFRHRVAAKEKRPQKIHRYSLLVHFSPAMHRNYLLVPMQNTSNYNKNGNKKKLRTRKATVITSVTWFYHSDVDAYA